MINLGRWIVTSAWPYAHDVIHLGNLIGSLLSADIFARYLRLKGEDVIYVTGSDQHGTPIEVKALKMGVPAEKLSDEIHEKIVEVLEGFNISTDNYTKTHNPNHIKFVQEFFLKIFRNGYIFAKEEEVLYCETDKIYLPDRFVVGTCPFCGYERARGDQCEECGTLLTPIQLVDAKCNICDTPPVKKTSKHFYFDLPKFSQRLIKFISESETLSDNAKKFSINMINQGLRPRSITRNNKWGIPAPFPGAEDLTIYVWFEAVLGYVSAVIEYFKKIGKEDEWRKWWLDPKTNIAFFIGKDNIPFHTIIFPALLMATHDNYSLNFYVGATEFLNYEGQKFSKSQGIGIWCDEALELLPSDYWRYALTYTRPEVKDTNFSWRTLEYTVNEELNNHFGNLLHRVLTFIKQHFDGAIPEAGPLSTDETKLLRKLDQVKHIVDKYYQEMRFQKVLSEIMNVAREANAVMNIEEPWKTVKKDKLRAGTTLNVISNVVKALAVMLYPIIPESSSKVLRYLGYNGDIHWDLIDSSTSGWKIDPNFKPAFSKVDIDELKQKLERIRSMEKSKLVDASLLEKLDIKVGEIVEVREIPKSKELYYLRIKVGDKIYSSVAKIGKNYTKKELLKKKVIVIVNLKPKKIRGILSEAMILAAEYRGNVSLLTIDKDIIDGASVF